MPFDESTVLSINPEVRQGLQVWVSWVPVESALTWQVYFNQSLQYHGSKTGVWLPAPSDTVRVSIGSVDPSEELTDFGATLPAAPARRASLSWTGGTNLGSDLDHFNVYGESTPGGGINYSKPLASVAAFAGGDPVASGSYAWTSGSLTSGTWHYAIRPVDVAGNEGAAQTASVVISAPPGPPSNLTYTFHPSGTTPTVTLTWTASPA